MEKDAVRTMVMLSIGAVTPISSYYVDRQLVQGGADGTSEESSKLFSLVCLLHAVEEARVIICLHSCFDTIQGEGCGSRENAGHGRGYLGAVLVEECVMATCVLLALLRRAFLVAATIGVVVAK